MNYVMLQQITMYLFVDNQVPSQGALSYAIDHGTVDLEDEAVKAFSSFNLTNEFSDAYLLVYGSKDELDTFRHLYPLLDKYLDDCFRDAIDV